MDTEKILSKLTSKDYHDELEIILEDKDFSEDVKNLLLSCVYKIEAGYKDYEIVKRVVLSKKDYLEEILYLIKDKCNHIEIRKDEDDEVNQKPKYEVDRLEGNITLWHPNEKILLYAIYELDDNQIYVDEKYSLIRTALSELLNKGENINRLEVLRDFNGWNWNTDPNELQNVTINLVYQNLIELLGTDFMEQWIHSKELKDYLGLAKQKILEQYGQKLEKDIFDLISKISLNVCIQTNEKEKQYLLEERKQIKEEYEKISNKKELLEQISNNKKEALKKIKEIDTILSDKKLLEKEFVSRNANLPEYHKIFSLAHLTEILTRQRKKIMVKMEEESKILEPVYYVEVKTDLEKRLDLLSTLELNNEEINEKITQDSIELQKKIMECFKEKVNKIDCLEKSEKKEQLINLAYKFRYYCHLYVYSNELIMNEKKIQRNVLKIKEIFIQKLEELKYISKVANNDKNIEILDILFNTRIISLENIVLEFKQKEQIYMLVYDTNTLEEEIALNIEKDDLSIKLDKKIKLLG